MFQCLLKRLADLFLLRLANTIGKALRLPDDRAVVEIAGKIVDAFVSGGAFDVPYFDPRMPFLKEMKDQFLECVGIEFLQALIKRMHIIRAQSWTYPEKRER